MCDKDNAKNLTTINSICGVMKFSGEDALDFLNKLLISDLLDLEKSTYCYTALCNPKGRIISSMWINVVSEEKINIICPKNFQDELIDFFSMRKFRLKIDIQLSNDNIVIKNNQSIALVTDIDKNKSLNEKASFYQFIFAKNLPWIDKNNTEKFIPQHVNLDQHARIMSFTKGCYPGQEIIARIKYLGKVKKRMELFNASSKELLQNIVSDLELTSPIIYLGPTNKYKAQAISSTSG